MTTGLMLGTEALKRLIAGEDKLADWLEQRGTTPVHTNCISVGTLLTGAEMMTNVTQRREWLRRLEQEVPADFGPRLQSFDMRAARRWSELQLAISWDVELVPEDVMIAAICLAEDLSYVAPAEAWHATLGLDVLDPWLP